MCGRWSTAVFGPLYYCNTSLQGQETRNCVSSSCCRNNYHIPWKFFLLLGSFKRTFINPPLVAFRPHTELINVQNPTPWDFWFNKRFWSRFCFFTLRFTPSQFLNFLYTERRNVVVNTPVSHLGGSRFEYWLGDYLVEGFKGFPHILRANARTTP